MCDLMLLYEKSVATCICPLAFAFSLKFVYYLLFVSFSRFLPRCDHSSRTYDNNAFSHFLSDINTRNINLPNCTIRIHNTHFFCYWSNVTKKRSRMISLKTRKRTCYINAGMTHNCDFKELLSAVNARKFWESSHSPGRRKRSPLREYPTYLDIASANHGRDSEFKSNDVASN